MSPSKVANEQRLERLQTVFAERRARLVAHVARQPTRLNRSRPIATLQQHGYSVALMLVLAAVLPTILGIAIKRRKLLASAVVTALRVRKLRERLKSAPSISDRP